MEAYEKGEKLGEGQFGVVVKARHKEVSSWLHTAYESSAYAAMQRLTGLHAALQTGRIVAIKKIHMGQAKEVCPLGPAACACMHGVPLVGLVGREPLRML